MNTQLRFIRIDRIYGCLERNETFEDQGLSRICVFFFFFFLRKIKYRIKY